MKNVLKLKVDDVKFLLDNKIKVSIVPKCLRLFIKSNDDRSLTYAYKGREVNIVDRILNPKLSAAINSIDSNSKFRRYKHGLMEVNIGDDTPSLVGGDREMKMAELLSFNWRPFYIFHGYLTEDDKDIVLGRVAGKSNKWKHLSFSPPTPSMAIDFGSMLIRWEPSKVKRERQYLEGFYINKMVESCHKMYMPVILGGDKHEKYVKCIDHTFKLFISKYGDVVKNIPAPMNKYHLFDIDRSIIHKDIDGIIDSYGDNAAWVYKVYMAMFRRKNPHPTLSDANKETWYRAKKMMETHSKKLYNEPYVNRIV